MHVVAIGGVAASMSMASKLKRMDSSYKISVFERGQDLSYGACGLPYYLSDLIPNESQLIAKTKADFEASGINVYLEHEVTRVNPKEKTITVSYQSKRFDVRYDKLVIGTGADPFRLPLKNNHFKEIMTLNSLEDGRRLKKVLKKDTINNITIVGGGYIGLEVAENLVEMGKNVRIIEREERLLATFDAFISEHVVKTLKSSNVQVHLNEQVVDYLGEEHLTHVKTDQGEYEADLVIEAVGIKPNTNFLKDIGLKTLPNGAIITNQYLQTNLEDIYAAGDCAAYLHRLTHKPAYIALGTHANKAGRVIASHITGSHEAFGGVIGSSVLKVLDLEIAKTGLSEKELKEEEIPYKTVTIKARDKAGYYPHANPIYIQVHYHKENCQLLGAQMVGTSGVAHRINVIAVAISQHMTAQAFSQLDLAYAPPFSPVYDPLQIATNQIKCKKE